MTKEQASGSPRQKTEQHHREENEMYGSVERELWRQRAEEIQQEVGVYRLEKMAPAKREVRPRLIGDSRWELERYAGLLKKRLGNLV